VSDINIIQGDSLEKLDDMEENSVHAIVTDPPYGLAFMGKSWDDFEPKEYQEWCEKWAKKCLRVLKPGGHMLAFSGSRTHHRLFTGIEDAGFEIRDTLTWHYGSGFPKGQDVGKSIDRWHEDAYDEREVISENPNKRSEEVEKKTEGKSQSGRTTQPPKTEPATSKAEKWDGWNTQMKPSTEFIVLARKPLSENAIYKNVLEHGTGALNIDRCRVPLADGEDNPSGSDATGDRVAEENYGFSGKDSGKNVTPDDGRYPSNLLLSDFGAKLLDELTEDSDSSKNEESDGRKSDEDIYDSGNVGEHNPENSYDDQGGKSRYFPKFREPRFKYNPKASKSERTHDGEVDNDHPTVKPKDLIRWLVRLVTREGQKVIDPFAGSGTTGLACSEENRECVLIEREEEYVDIIRERLDE
jgi:site-specific DNA-methyltransferase (adenine-specific)